MTFQTETKVSSCLILTDKLEIPEKSKKKKELDKSLISPYSN